MSDSPEHDIYLDPLTSRYASREMLELFSDQRGYGLWRRLWLALAEAQAELGLDISPAQLDELRAHLDDVDYELAAQKEKELRHDVMAHIHASGHCAPQAWMWAITS